MIRPLVMVLLGRGRHPVTGRPRRADLDARALELALRLPDAAVVGVHAGAADRAALSAYLGMGLTLLTVLEIGPDTDPLPALATHARILRPALILSGLRADDGEASGFLPYALAHALGAPIAAGICALELEAGQARLVQALPRGRRRALAARLPLVATVGDAATDPGPVAFARARRGLLDVVREHAATANPAPVQGQIRPARLRPKALAGASGLSGEERLKALLEGPNRGGGVLAGLPAAEAADQLLAYLAREGLIADPTRGADR